MTTTNPLERAAELLRGCAHELQEGHTSHRAPADWTGEDEAKSAYDEHLAVAAALERERARVQELERAVALAEMAAETEARYADERCAKAAAAEREACAALVEGMTHLQRVALGSVGRIPTPPCSYAAAIRARGAQGESDDQ